MIQVMPVLIEGLPGAEIASQVHPCEPERHRHVSQPVGQRPGCRVISSRGSEIGENQGGVLRPKGANRDQVSPGPAGRVAVPGSDQQQPARRSADPACTILWAQ
jgi:hypothetical protein